MKGLLNLVKVVVKETNIIQESSQAESIVIGYQGRVLHSKPLPSQKRPATKPCTIFLGKNMAFDRATNGSEHLENPRMLHADIVPFPYKPLSIICFCPASPMLHWSLGMGDP